jgi:hypothetical protein
MIAEVLSLKGAWSTFLLSIFVFGLAPGAALRLILLMFPKDDPRRKELIAELYAIPRPNRPFWVAEQIEVATFEGLPGRLEARKTRKANQKRKDISDPEFHGTGSIRVRSYRRSIAGSLPASKVTLVAGVPALLVMEGAPAALPVSVAGLGFFLFLLPRPCEAGTAAGTLCRRRARGLLGGCHNRRHKMENAWRVVPTLLRPLVVQHTRANSRTRANSARMKGRPGDRATRHSASTRVTTIGSVGSSVAVIISLGAWLFPT